MAEPPAAGPLLIRKYANRRFYDTTRGEHVTLSDIHSLVAAGHDVTITDSTTGNDITNAILTQIILERDSAKLGLFPANVLHEMIRTQQQFLGGVLERFFAQFVTAQRASQERWAAFLGGTLGSTPPLPANPLDWTRRWFEALTALPGADAGGAPADETKEQSQPAADAVRELQAQVQKLGEQIARLQRGRQ